MAGNRAGTRESRKRTRSRDTDVAPAGRGRPHKFGRPSQVVALTLPNDILDSLQTLHGDPGWAIVRLVESTLGDGLRGRAPRRPRPLAELVHLPGKRGLILVQSEAFKHLRGISTIPLADGRAFLAFDEEGGLTQLEVAIIDALEGLGSERTQHARLLQIRNIVRGWRRDPRLTFRAKSIIVVDGLAAAEREPLSPLREAAGSRKTGKKTSEEWEVPLPRAGVSSPSKFRSLTVTGAGSSSKGH